jgi:hypothetical protein
MKYTGGCQNDFSVQGVCMTLPSVPRRPGEGPDPGGGGRLGGLRPAAGVGEAALAAGARDLGGAAVPAPLCIFA